jgi:hypothetical protein
MDNDLYIAKTPFNVDRMPAAAIYCSDGRYGEQMDEFLHQSLRLPRYDRVAIPGGAAALAEHMHAYAEGSALKRQIRFLIESHELTRIVLIAHQDCGFYKHAWLAGRKLVDQQHADLQKAAEKLRSWHTDLQVDAFYAHKSSGNVTFERWPLLEPVAGLW